MKLPDSFSRYDIKRPVRVQPHGGNRLGSGRKGNWPNQYYPLRKLQLPDELAQAIIEARDAHVDVSVLIEAIKNIGIR